MHRRGGAEKRKLELVSRSSAASTVGLPPEFHETWLALDAVTPKQRTALIRAMTDRTETLLRETPQAVAAKTTVTSDWHRLASDLSSEHQPMPLRPARNRGRILMAAAALALFAGGSYALTRLGTGNEVSVTAGIDYVLPGETVLSRDPLIVSAAPGPEPLFDTSGLGQEQMPTSAEIATLPGAGYTTTAGWVTWDGLPSDTQMWIRVRSGLAVFPAEFSPGETFHLAAFGADGEQLGDYSQRISDLADPNPEVLEAGDVLETMSMVDVDGNLVELSGSGTTVLVYGAIWCPPCSSVMTDALPTLEALGDDVAVYSIAAADGPDGPAVQWPADGWPFTRLAPGPGSVLLGIEAYPQTVVLGPNNTVLASFIGFEDYANQLADVGLG